MPGEVEWWRVFQPGEFTARVWADGLMEGFMYPPEQYWGPGADTVCWQYNFRMPEAEAFIQQGTETDPVVYWLDVQAIVSDPEAWFGWKTSPEHWNDKAVFTMGTEPYSGPWQELFYPPGHEWFMQPIDLAFVIQGAPLVEELDFGDAPDSYQTTLAMDGARHAAQAGYCMGTLIDTEPDGQPSVDAKGDDNNNLADEDGVIAGTDLIPGGTCTVAIRASAAGYLDGWIDWAGDGSFAESGDRLWAVLRNFPENYYGGYYPTLQCIARRGKSGWTAVAERPRVESVGLAGDQPGIQAGSQTRRQVLPRDTIVRAAFQAQHLV